MRSELFRHEVLEARAHEPLGTIRLAPPHFGWTFSLGGLASIVLIALLLAFGRYTRHETVQGRLVPNNGLLPVIAARPGIVVRTMCAIGARVSAGQALVEISGEQDSASLGDMNAGVIAQLNVKAAKLKSDLGEQARLSQAQKQDLRTRVGILESRIEQMNSQIALQKERASGAQSLYEQFVRIGDTGVVSKLQILQQHDAALASQTEVKQSTQQALDLEQQLAQLKNQLSALPFTLQMQRNDIERQLADVNQSLSVSEAGRAIVLRAPTDGTITNLLVHTGQPVAAQQLLLDVLPKDSQLQAELWVPSRVVGQIATGDVIVLRYEAYPYEKFGQKAGRIREVSRSPLSSAELYALLGHKYNEPRYRVLVDLDSQVVRANGRNEPLLPGISLQGDILLESRRLISWIVQPLYGLAPRAPLDVSTKKPRK